MANNASPDPIPLLMTRPRAASQAFVESLPKETALRVVPVYSPLIAIKGLDPAPALSDKQAAIFTSANGVTYGPKGEGRPAYCIGAATTQIARSNGWDAQMRGETADTLIADLLRDPPREALIHFSGVHTRGNVSARLVDQGVQAKNTAVYDQVAQSLSTDATVLLAGRKAVLVPLFSPRTSAQFAIEAPRAMSGHIIALSNAVAQNLEAASYAKVTVTSAPNAGAMRSAIFAALSDLPAG